MSQIVQLDLWHFALIYLLLLVVITVLRFHQDQPDQEPAMGQRAHDPAAHPIGLILNLYLPKPAAQCSWRCTCWR